MALPLYAERFAPMAEKREPTPGRMKAQRKAMESMSKSLLNQALQGRTLGSQAMSAASTLAKPKKAKVSVPKPPKQKAKAKALTAKAKPTSLKKNRSVLRTPSAPAQRLLVSDPDPKYLDKEFLSKAEQPTSWTDQEKEAYQMARAFDHDRYLAYQDGTPLDCIVTNVTYYTSFRGIARKSKSRDTVMRNNALQSVLERMADISHLRAHLVDDNKVYKAVKTYTKNKITIGGVVLSFGFREEQVLVPATGLDKIANRKRLDRFESIKSRIHPDEGPATQADVGLVTDAAEKLEDLPPWDGAEQLTVDDAVSRGYASLESEFDAPVYRVFETPLDQRNEFRIRGQQHKMWRERRMQDIMTINALREDHMNYLQSMATTGTPFYGVAANDNPDPDTPAPAAVPDWGNLQEEELHSELQKSFVALHDRLVAYELGHFKPETVLKLTSNNRFDMTPEQWVQARLTRKINGRNKAREIAATRPKKKVGVYVSKLRERRNLKNVFHAEQDARLSQYWQDRIGFGAVQYALKCKEQTYPSDPRCDAQRYYDWMYENANPDMTMQELWEHLGRMDEQEKYNDIFGVGVINQRASYRTHKPLPVPKARSLSRPEDNIHLNLPPTGAAPVVTVTDKVGQDDPDFLIAGDNVIVPFRGGMGTSTEGLSPSMLNSQHIDRLDLIVRSMFASVNNLINDPKALVA